MKEVEMWIMLPDEIMRTILEHLPMAELIFSLSNTCHCFRKITFPIISDLFYQHVNSLNDNITINDKFNNYNQLFKSKSGRNFIRKSVREYVYELACNLVKVDEKLCEIAEEIPVFTFEKAMDFSDILNRNQELKDRIEFTSQLFKNFHDLKGFMKPKIKKKEVQEEEIKYDNSLFGGLLRILSPLFGYSPSKDNEILPKYSNAHKYKCVMSGAHNVGKTSFLYCVLKNRQSCNYHDNTIGACFIRLIYQFNDEEIQLEMWDNGTSNRFESISPFYFKGAYTVYCMFDVNDFSKTFQRVEFDMKDIVRMKKPNLEIILIGNKTDLLREEMDGTRKKAHSYAFNEMNGSLYFEMTTLDIQSAHCIILYSALMAHFTNPDSSFN